MPDETEQERFWSGDFGDEYTDRNSGAQFLAANVALFSKMFAGRSRPLSVIELGANIGMNLRALQILFPEQEQHAVEINRTAASRLAQNIGRDSVFQQSVLDWTPERQWDLALIKGVLIHIHPARLMDVYDRLAAASSRYVAICEYYSPTPVEVTYRGHEGRLFKRDFCGEFLDRHGDFELLDYGFLYRRDPAFPADDITWFLCGRVASG